MLSWTPSPLLLAPTASRPSSDVPALVPTEASLPLMGSRCLHSLAFLTPPAWWEFEPSFAHLNLMVEGRGIAESVNTGGIPEGYRDIGEYNGDSVVGEANTAGAPEAGGAAPGLKRRAGEGSPARRSSAPTSPQFLGVRGSWGADVGLLPAVLELETNGRVLQISCAWLGGSVLPAPHVCMWVSMGVCMWAHTHAGVFFRGSHRDHGWLESYWTCVAKKGRQIVPRTQWASG